MSNGTAGIGSVPAYNPHNEAAGSMDYDDRLTVSAVWTSFDSGVELSGGEIDGHYYLTNHGALKLAELLLKACQPANTPGNGYEEWADAARKAVERALDPAQGFEFDAMVVDDEDVATSR